MSQILLKVWLPEKFDVVLMCETFGQDPSLSIFEWFLLFMNCCNMFFHVILDRKLNVSDTSDSSFMRYGLTFTIFNFLIPVKQHQGSAGAILAFIGLCAGLDARKIASMKFAQL